MTDETRRDNSESGVYECHGHIIADGVDYRSSMLRHEKAPDEAYIRKTLAAVSASGIVYYRDGGDAYGVSPVAKKIAAEYGVEYRTPVFIAYREGYYGKAYGKAYNSSESLTALLREAERQDADFIKIAVSGMLDFDGNGEVLGDALPVEEVYLLVESAKRAGYRVMAHANGAENIKSALYAGVKSIEHGFWADIETINLMREHEVVWVPTCVTVSNNTTGGRYPEPTMRRILEHHTGILKNAASAGVLIACGSDCGAYGVHQGSGTLEERLFLLELGIETFAADNMIRKMFKRF